MAGSFYEMLKKWEGTEVTIINPQSYTVSNLKDGITFESYPAVLTSVQDAHIQVTFQYKKKGEEQPVEQYIPLAWVKRASLWGEQKYIQL